MAGDKSLVSKERVGKRLIGKIEKERGTKGMQKDRKINVI